MAVDVKSSTKLDDKVLKDAMETSLGESEIQKVFAGSTVLVTGGTGFLGRLLVEKLLRSCPDLKKVYLLTRPKKNKEIVERLHEQFNDVLYDRLRKERPDFIDKIGIVVGDVGELHAGISEESRAKIINEAIYEYIMDILYNVNSVIVFNHKANFNVINFSCIQHLINGHFSPKVRITIPGGVDIIFHGAATVRFDEELKTAVNINVRGARELLLLAKSCTKLRAFVHISTAYSNCNLKEIDEKFYESPIDGEKLIALADNIDDKTLNNVTPMLLGEFPNTYAFTKAAAEDIVQKYSKGLPVVVYRPSIVISTAEEPVPGWINNVYGPTGVVVGAAIGLIHVLHCNPKAVADVVPGDMVVNCCIACAWKMARDFPRNHEDAPPLDQTPTVYNFVSSVDKPLSWEFFMSTSETHGLPIPPVNAVWYYSFMLTNSKILYELLFFFLQWVPAYIVDGIAIMLGKKPMLRKAYGKIKKFSTVIRYFSIRDWKFENNNTKALYKEMCIADQTYFNFDISKLDWDTYFHNYVQGLRTYLLKQSDDNIEYARKRHFILKVVHNALKYFLILSLFYIIFKLLS